MLDDLFDPIMGRPMYFDKQGNPISMRQMSELKWPVRCAGDGEWPIDDYARVGHDVVGDATISTVWLGIDHGFHYGDEPYKPVIFETMIFGGEYDQATMRYCTEDEARKGHDEAVADVRAGMKPWCVWNPGNDRFAHLDLDGST